MRTETPDYYTMAPGQDLFAWLGTLPLPQFPARCILEAWGLYVTGLRYARRCLWKGPTTADMASDCRKAAACFLRLALLLEPPQATATADAPPPTIRYDQLSASMRDWVRRSSEPGSRWYYVMATQHATHQRAHEWPQYEQVHADVLANGAVRRVVLPEEMQR